MKTLSSAHSYSLLILACGLLTPCLTPVFCLHFAEATPKLDAVEKEGGQKSHQPMRHIVDTPKVHSSDTDDKQKKGHPQHEKHSPAHHHSFAKPAHWAKKWEGSERDEQQKPKDVMDHCGIKKGMTVVDLGAGTGYFTPYLSDRVTENGIVYALDVEQKMISWLKNKVEHLNLKNIRTRLVQPADPMLDDASIDLILIVNVWHHIDHRTQYLEKLKRALKPSGRLCIVEIKPDAPYGPPKKYRLSEESLRDELRSGGGIALETLELSTQYVVRGQFPQSPPSK